jgi:hypothetical protein
MQTPVATSVNILCSHMLTTMCLQEFFNLILWVEHGRFLKTRPVLLLLDSVYSCVSLVELLWWWFWSNSRTVWNLLVCASKLERQFAYWTFSWHACVSTVAAPDLWSNSERRLYNILTFFMSSPSLICLQCSSMHIILPFNTELSVEFQTSSSVKRSTWSHLSSFAKGISALFVRNEANTCVATTFRPMEM